MRQREPRFGCRPDWARCQERYEAFWASEVLDRPLIQITAPLPGVPARPLKHISPADETGLRHWFTDPELVLPRLTWQAKNTYYAGDAFPLALPVSGGLVAILAAYLGCPYRMVPGTDSAWADPIIEEWDSRPSFTFSSDNEWWQISRRLLEAATETSNGEYLIGVPDLQGDGQVVALLRGTERLALDMIEHPEEVKVALAEVNAAWLSYWRECNRIIGSGIQGYVDWLGVWSRAPAVTLECDFSCMISPQMFNEVFLPGIAQQAQWVPRTIYHLDGPGAVRHLEALLSLAELSGIQWVPGAGAAAMSEWVPLLQRIQAAGKLLVIACEAGEVAGLLSQLRPEGLLLSTHCGSVEEADELLAQVEREFVRRCS